jgi:HhH-GPD superfamily base excision DNA repair protein
VTGQQLSVASRRRILDRIQEMFGGHLPSPAELLQADPAGLRKAGLSGRKVSTLRDLAERLTDGRLNADALSARTCAYRAHQRGGDSEQRHRVPAGHGDSDGLHHGPSVPGSALGRRIR